MDSSPSIRRTVACTGNLHKVEELGALLPEFRFEPLEPGTVLPPEVGETFLDNARIKALAGHGMYPDHWVLADDSGLCVDALDGAPGVRSARFAGEDATDADNVARLLHELEGHPDPADRSARFVCVLALIAPDGTETFAEGTVEGTIIDAPAGDSGFGYDPVFVPQGEQDTFAQLGVDVKARMSHRARAARDLQQRLVVPAR